MQKQYLYIDDQEVFNGHYMLAVFKLRTYNNIPLDDAATELAAESSTGSNLKVATATLYSQNIDARVYKVDEDNGLVYIAYPWTIFDSDGNVQNILTFIAGNVFGMSEFKECKLLDVWFPSQMLDQYDGPSVTLDDMREYLKNYDKPVLGTIIKPKIGLTSTEYAEICYDYWAGGGDFVKNDEPQANQSFSPYEKMVVSVKEAMDRAEDYTGKTKIHSFNVSAADFDTMIKRADFVASVMKPGSYAFLVDGITAGWTAVQTIRRHYPHAFIHFHRAGHGAFTRAENPIGYSVLVLSKFARLAGASGIHTGTAGIGKMAGDAKDDITAAHAILRLKSKGHHFDQIWSEVPVNDFDIVAEIKKEEDMWAQGARAISNSRSNGLDTFLEKRTSWRIIGKTAPIISGGLNPVLLPQFLDTVGTIDFITTMGGGVHSHPMGTKAGATAVLQAYEAWKQDVSLEEYAKDHEELKVAAEFYNKNGIQAHRVDNSAVYNVEDAV
ncbi:ribulose-bisphosphate carboxylase [bacterium]|nr:ribulose-bisphosphate carboxylase [bacterium]